MKLVTLILVLLISPYALGGMPGEDEINSPFACVELTEEDQAFLAMLHDYFNKPEGDCVKWGDIYGLEDFQVEGQASEGITFDQLAIFDDFTRVRLGEKGTEKYIEGVIFANIFHPGMVIGDRFIHGFWVGEKFLPGVVMSDGNQTFFTPGLTIEGVGFIPGVAVHDAFGHELSLLFEQSRFTPGLFMQEADLVVFNPGNFDVTTGLFLPGTIVNIEVFNPEIYSPDFFGSGFLNFAGLMFDFSAGDVWEHWWEHSFGTTAPDYGSFCTIMGSVGAALGALASIFGVVPMGILAATMAGAAIGGAIAGVVLLAGYAAIGIYEWFFGDDDGEDDGEDDGDDPPSVVDPCWDRDCGHPIAGDWGSISNFFFNNLIAINNLVFANLEPVILDPLDPILDPIDWK